MLEMPKVIVDWKRVSYFSELWDWDVGTNGVL